MLLDQMIKPPKGLVSASEAAKINMTPKERSKKIEIVCELYEKRKTHELKLKQNHNDIKSIEIEIHEKVIKGAKKNIETYNKKMVVDMDLYLVKICEEHDVKHSGVKRIIGI